MVGSKMLVNLIESGYAKIALPPVQADLRWNIFDNIEFTLEPMLALDFLVSRLPTTELANHTSSIRA